MCQRAEVLPAALRGQHISGIEQAGPHRHQIADPQARVEQEIRSQNQGRTGESKPKSEPEAGG